MDQVQQSVMDVEQLCVESFIILVVLININARYFFNVISVSTVLIKKSAKCRLKVSKITDCKLERQRDLMFDFYYGSCQ